MISQSIGVLDLTGRKGRSAVDFGQPAVGCGIPTRTIKFVTRPIACRQKQVGIVAPSMSCVAHEAKTVFATGKIDPGSQNNSSAFKVDVLICNTSGALPGVPIVLRHSSAFRRRPGLLPPCRVWPSKQLIPATSDSRESCQWLPEK
jgi:hypothetical protein